MPNTQVKPDPKPTSSKTAKQSRGKHTTPPPVEEVTKETTAARAAATAKTGRGGARAKSDLSADVEAKVVEAVESVVPKTDEWYAPSLRYGRKVAKVAKGLRATPAPLAGLSKERGAEIKNAVETTLAS